METIVVKKVVPPTQGDDSKRKQVVKEGMDAIIRELKNRGYLSCEEEKIDDYSILTFKIDDKLVLSSQLSDASSELKTELNSKEQELEAK